MNLKIFTGFCFLFLSVQGVQAVGFDDINVLTATEIEKEVIREKLYTVSRIQENQNSIVKPYERWEDVKIKAEQEDAEAQCKLAYMYRFAKGGIVQQDKAQALLWYERSALQGNPNAAHCLGYMYRVGEGVILNDAQAAQFFLQAANQGHVVAMGLLGTMYNWGQGVPQNRDIGKFWYDEYHIAAERIGQMDDAGLIVKN